MEALKILSMYECVSWCEANHIAVENNRPVPNSKPNTTLRTSGMNLRQLALARDVAARMRAEEEVLFWLVDWPFCKDDQLELVMVIHRAYGDHRPLIQAPGHLFSEARRPMLSTLIHLVIAYGWDAYLLGSLSGLAARFTNDEYADLFVTV
jgi:hypothetical protein